ANYEWKRPEGEGKREAQGLVEVDVQHGGEAAPAWREGRRDGPRLQQGRVVAPTGEDSLSDGFSGPVEHRHHGRRGGADRVGKSRRALLGRFRPEHLPAILEALDDD